MTEDKIVEKIKKLLALASSPNENEAQLAMERAQSLMAEYCIQENQFFDRNSLNVTFRESVIFELYTSPFNASRGLQKELPQIVHTIGRIFGCMCMIWRPTLEYRIYGFKTNIEITKYTIDAILNQARIDYQIGYRKARTISFDESFWKAFAIILRERFQKHVEESTGLVIYDAVRAKIKELSKGIYISHNGTDSIAGVKAGQLSGSSVSIHPGIKVGNQGNLLE